MFRIIFSLIAQYWKTIIWFIIVFLLSTMQISNVPKSPLFALPHFDKIVHFTMYFIAVTLWQTDYYKTKTELPTNIVFRILLSTIAYGLLMELIQKYLIQNRSGNFFDALANTAGVLFAFILFRYFLHYRKLIVRILKLI